MRTPQEIYTAYRIMPSLQLHMLRVAAVGKLVSESLSIPVDTSEVVRTCLFHDMGNLIKSNLSVFPEFSQPEGIPYWEGVKKEFIERYGGDSHTANVAIAREIGLPGSVTGRIDALSFSNMAEIESGDSWELKIAQYADLRVGPRGVLTLDERLADGRARYLAAGKTRGLAADEKTYASLLSAVKKLEQDIFEYSSIAPSDVNDEMVLPLIEELRKYPVS